MLATRTGSALRARAVPAVPRLCQLQTPRMALVKPLRAVMEPQMAPMTSKLEQKLRKAQMKLEKAQMKFSMAAAEARGTLYMLHWHSVAPSSVVADAKAGEKSCSLQTQAYITKLQDDLKRMEAVSKDAMWYLTKEAEDGMHVVLVTNVAKHAAKYNLVELPLDVETHSVQLGSAGTVEIPVASLRAMALNPDPQVMASLSSHDDISHVDTGCGNAGSMVVAEKMKAQLKMEEKEDKKRMKEEKKKEKMMVMEGSQEGMACATAVAAGERMEKEEKKRMKEERKAMEKQEKREKEMAAAATMMAGAKCMGDEEDSSESSSSEEEEMMMGASQMTAGKMEAGGGGGIAVEEDPVAKAHAMQLMGQVMDGSPEKPMEGKRAEAMMKMGQEEEEEEESCSESESESSSDEEEGMMKPAAMGACQTVQA